MVKKNWNKDNIFMQTCEVIQLDVEQEVISYP